MKKLRKKSIAAVLILCLVFCLVLLRDAQFRDATGIGNDKAEFPGAVNSDGYAVSSTSPLATAVGEEILKKGGNAVDAAVAVAMTLAVVEPYASGFGGSGFMLVYDPSVGEAYSVDYYAASGRSETETGVVGIPGFLKGQQAALDKWGTMTLSELIEPAIRCAEEGFGASALLVRRLKGSEVAKKDAVFSNLQEGDLVVQKDLAELLRRIQSEGTDAFYSGKNGEAIADASGLSMEDLENYQVYIEPAVSTEAFGYTFYGTFAPSSSLTTLQMLGLAEKIDIADRDENLGEYLLALQKITALSYSSRSKTLVDPRFYDYDAADLLSDEYLEELLRKDEPESSAIDPERTCTTQFSVIDSNGLTVCVTNTLSDNWGSGISVSGVYLNNTLSLFGNSAKLGYGPNKRPRTHISPIIATNREGYILAIGSPGGANIPKIVAAALIDILKYGEEVQAAIEKPRIVIDEKGWACVEVPDDVSQEVNTEQIPITYYLSYSHLYFGCTSVVGRTAEHEVFAYGDDRRLDSSGESANPFQGR